MEFRLLGPFEAVAEGIPLEMGRRRECGVLAILLLDIGQPVMVERLIELLFDDDPPRDPRNELGVPEADRVRGLLSRLDQATRA